MVNPFKSYTVDGKYRTKKGASARAKKLRPRFTSVKVHKGTSGAAWGNKKIAYRVLVK